MKLHKYIDLIEAISELGVKINIQYILYTYTSLITSVNAKALISPL